MASESHKKISDCVYDMTWYKVNTQLQKYFLLMIANMQKPLFYHGFEIVDLDLRTFIRVSICAH